jgi:hypothetical protein
MPEHLSTETPGDQNAHKSIDIPAITEEQIIPLLEERVVVDNSKQRIGEVIVRKEIETQFIQVPVRREKLIVEQITSQQQHQQLAEIDLSQGEIPGVELTTGENLDFASFDSGLVVNGEFDSPKIASLMLNAIALERDNGCKKIKVAVLVENESQRQKYQEWFSRCAQS